MWTISPSLNVMTHAPLAGGNSIPVERPRSRRSSSITSDRLRSTPGKSCEPPPRSPATSLFRQAEIGERALVVRVQIKLCHLAVPNLAVARSLGPHLADLEPTRLTPSSEATQHEDSFLVE